VVPGDGVFINELYPSSGEDWIELYNALDKEKDLSGYRIYDNITNKYTLPQGTVIAAKGFLVLICDDTGTELHTSFKLSATGETIYLENPAGTLIDRVEFLTLKDGESYGRYPDGADDWGVSAKVTKGSSNGNTQSAIIASVSRNILVPKPDESVVITAKVVSNSGISAVKLFYRYNSGSFTELAMMGSGGSYVATIPALHNTGVVEYYISATNNSSLVTLSPFDAPDKTYHYLLNTDELPQLRINEFLANNTSCCPDIDGGTEEFDDWIEIYNAGNTAVNIGGMFLSDDKDDPFKSHISETDAALTTIQPGSFKVIWADEQGSQGPLHMNFKLASDGEDIGIFYKDGRTIDIYTFGAQQENISIGLENDGGSTWKSFAVPTPKMSNE
jgi:hypothetical protein